MCRPNGSLLDVCFIGRVQTRPCKMFRADGSLVTNVLEISTDLQFRLLKNTTHLAYWLFYVFLIV